MIGELEIEARLLNDGIYDCTGLETKFLGLGWREAVDHPQSCTTIQEWSEKHPNFRVGSAYETYGTVLLSSAPPKASPLVAGSGFNYGSTNLLSNCPAVMLILAEND